MKEKINFDQQIKIYKSVVDTIKNNLTEDSSLDQTTILSATDSEIGVWFYKTCKLKYGHVDEIKILQIKHLKLHKIATEIHSAKLKNNLMLANEYYEDLAKTGLEINKLLLKAQQTLNQGIIDEKEYNRNLNTPLIRQKNQTISLDIDSNGTIVMISDDFLSLTGYSNKDVMGQKFTFNQSTDMPNIVSKYLLAGLKDMQIAPSIIKFRAVSGKFFWTLITGRIFEKEDGAIDIISFTLSIIDQQIIDDHIEPLYTKLKQIEDQIDIDSSKRYFASYLKEKNRSYEDFVNNLVATGKNDKFYSKKGVFGATLKLFNL